MCIGGKREGEGEKRRGGEGYFVMKAICDRTGAGFSPPLSMMHFTPNPPVSWRHTSTRFGVVFRSTTLTIFKIKSVYVSNTRWRSFQYSLTEGWMEPF